MPDIHFRYGGSNAAQVLGCPGSVQQSAGLPDSTSIYAAEGTAKHDCMEEMLLDAKEPEDFIDVTVRGIPITEEVVEDQLRPAMEAFKDLCDAYGVTEYEAETFCKLADDVGGTADFIARGTTFDGKTFGIVGDFKFGQGIMVYPEQNAQAMFYAMCALHDSTAKELLVGVDTLVAAIIQPNGRDEPVLRTWEFDASDLSAFKKNYERALKESRLPRPPLNAGDHCRWCKAASICPEKTGDAHRALQMDPEDLDCLAESMRLADELKSWISSVERVAFEQLNAGCVVEGWKLVAKRATARWRDEAEVIKAFRRRLGGIKGMTKQTLLSPAQMRKVAAARGADIDFDEFIIKSSTGNTIAPESDKRPAVLAGEAMAQALNRLK